MQYADSAMDDPFSELRDNALTSHVPATAEQQALPSAGNAFSWAPRNNYAACRAPLDGVTATR
jgi:hypothetical protein